MRSQFLPLDAERMARQPLVPFSNIYKQYARNSRKENICLKLACFFFFDSVLRPFQAFHSYRDESIGRWGENRSTRGKTT